MMGRIHNKIVHTPLEEAYTKKDKIDESWIKISEIISL
jgi:hypothetical protein